jgi:hypothetical protein
MPELRFPGDKVLVLADDPRLDEAALLAFLGGHCHSLALALHQETDWPLVAIDRRADGVCVHVAVQRDDGRIIDIAGAHTLEHINDAVGGGAVIRQVTAIDLDELHHKHHWAKPDPDAVSPWVETVLGQAKREPLEPMATPRFICKVTTRGGIDVCVSCDGEPYFEVEVRRTEPVSPWVSYGLISFPKDEDGLWRYSFTAEWFRRLAEAWLDREFDETRAERLLAG